MPRKYKWPEIPAWARITSKRSYQVLFTDEFLKDHQQLGECRFEPPQIVIKNGQSELERFGTYAHEVIHAASEEFDIGLTESQVRKLEKALVTYMKLNNLV
jgi:hypothetical protein